MKRSFLATAGLAVAVPVAGTVAAQKAQAAFDEDLPSLITGSTSCIEKKVLCRMMATFPDGSMRAVYGTKTCFDGSIWLCPPCGPCEIDDLTF